MIEIKFTMLEVAKLADHCQDFYATEGFDRTRFFGMLMQVAALVTAESMVNSKKYGATVALDDVEKESRKMVGLVEQYIGVLKGVPRG